MRDHKIFQVAYERTNHCIFVQTIRGSSFRVAFTMLSMTSLLLAADQNKNVLKLGFFGQSPFESSYKMKPDYMTQTVFAAERKDVR